MKAMIRKHIVLMQTTTVLVGLTRINRDQNWLAHRILVSNAYLSQMLNRRRPVSPAFRSKIMAALGIKNFDTIFEIQEIQKANKKKYVGRHHQ